MRQETPTSEPRVNGADGYKKRRVGTLLVYCGLLLAALLLLIHGIYFTHEQLEDERYLRDKVLPNVSEGTGEQILISALSAAFHLPPHRGPGNSPNYQISHPVLSALGPPASLIHQHGGHCGRRSRLLMSILKLKGIPAHKVHLINSRYSEFNHSHKYVHAVVEVKVNDRWVIADPLYNIVFRTSSGEAASIDDIRTMPKSVFAAGITAADTRYAPYYLELYTYDEYRKFIWNSFPAGELLYDLISKWFGEEVATRIRGPRLIEQPLRALALTSYAGAAFLFIVAIFYRRRRLSSITS